MLLPVALLVTNVAALLQRFNKEDKMPNCRFLRVSLFSSSYFTLKSKQSAARSKNKKTQLLWKLPLQQVATCATSIFVHYFLEKDNEAKQYRKMSVKLL